MARISEKPTPALRPLERSTPPMKVVERPAPDVDVRQRFVAPTAGLRRPPEMAIPDSLETDDVSAPDPSLLAGIAQTEPSQLAYSVAALAVRLQARVLEQGEPAATRGLAALEQQARLFEHLHILRTDDWRDA